MNDISDIYIYIQTNVKNLFLELNFRLKEAPVGPNKFCQLLVK